jgi:hypothetical protein
MRFAERYAWRAPWRARLTRVGGRLWWVVWLRTEARELWTVDVDNVEVCVAA